MAEDLEAFEVDSGYEPGEVLELRRVALTPAQIVELGIEAKPDAINPDDPRAPGFQAKGLLPAQLEAMPPDVLSSVARRAVEDVLDLDQLRASQEREQQERDEVQARLDIVNETLREAFRG